MQGNSFLPRHVCSECVEAGEDGKEAKSLSPFSLSSLSQEPGDGTTFFLTTTGAVRRRCVPGLATVLKPPRKELEEAARARKDMRNSPNGSSASRGKING